MERRMTPRAAWESTEMETGPRAPQAVKTELRGTHAAPATWATQG